MGSTVLAGVLATILILSVNAFPMIGNDSVVYITHSLDLASGGWVVDGFRQVGYPLALSVVRGLSTTLGAEPLLAMVILQRALVVLACVLAFWKLRWWSLPLVLFLLIPTNIAYTNLLLTEGLGLPLAVLTTLSAWAYIDLARGDLNERRRTMGTVLFGLACVGALALFAIRFTYAVFAIVPLVLSAVSWRTPLRNRAMVIGGLFVLSAGLFTLMLAVENQEELGVTSPSTGALPGLYYYAWMQVFVVNPDNQTDADLAVFYDAGVVHDFSREVTAAGIPYAEQDEVYAAEVEAMLETAGASIVGSQVESMLWALRGGRLHDIQGAIARILSAGRDDIDETTYLNRFANENGIQAFADRYNHGVTAGAIITNPAGVRLPIPSGRALLSLLLPLVIAVMMVGLLVAGTRPVAVIGLAVVLGTAVGVGIIRADNYRFLIVSSAAGLAVVSAMLPQIVGSVDKWRARRGGEESASV